MIDIGQGTMYFLPEGTKVKYELPPGTVIIPLETAPSGHLVMPVDAYERVDKQSGGVPDLSLNLLAQPAPSDAAGWKNAGGFPAADPPSSTQNCPSPSPEYSPHSLSPTQPFQEPSQLPDGSPQGGEDGIGYSQASKRRPLTQFQ